MKLNRFFLIALLLLFITGSVNAQVAVASDTVISQNNPVSVNHTLIGRSAISITQPICQSIESGIIVVKIWVNRNGVVTKVEAPEKGSTISDIALISTVKEAAFKANFSADENAPEEQIGRMTYVFK